MADSVISLDKLRAFWHSQVNDEENWAHNMKLLRAAGLFGGAIRCAIMVNLWPYKKN